MAKKSDKKSDTPSPTKALQVARAALLAVTLGKCSAAHDQVVAAVGIVDAALGVKSK